MFSCYSYLTNCWAPPLRFTRGHERRGQGWGAGVSPPLPARTLARPWQGGLAKEPAALDSTSGQVAEDAPGAPGLGCPKLFQPRDRERPGV